MDDTTIKRLIALNRAFYETAGDAFDQTRGRPWPGWRAILPHLPPVARMLDAGCGNGRFARFLAEESASRVTYVGVDSSRRLLEHARHALADLDAQLVERDILRDPLPPGPFDLIALFGVLHHVPGASTRRDLMFRLANQLAPGGMLFFSAWRFYDFARFRQRIAPWPTDLSAEPGDYLLDWRRGERALRYCHHVDQAEHAALIAASGLREITTFCADGESEQSNRYSLLRREP